MIVPSWMLQVRDLLRRGAPEDLDALDLLGCDEDGDGFYVFNLGQPVDSLREQHPCGEDLRGELL
ncbi:MAG: hypothetical protein R2781_08615 [Flavobacteriaceae bacterium]